MWSSWFGGLAPPSDYGPTEMPDFNMDSLLICSVFILPYLAFLIVLPGVRRKRIVTLVIISTNLFIGSSIAASLYYPSWAGGSARIYSQFRSHTDERMRAVIGVHIGVQKINVTLKFEEMVFSDPLAPHIDMAKLHYNEQFAITDVSSMSQALKSAYKHGLPYPILSVLEYLSLNQDAFDWGKHYRTAGHYTHAAMCFALSVWCLSLVLLLFLPHSYGMAMLICGAACLIGNLIYLLLSPCELQVAFTGVYGERVNLDVSFQTVFYLIFAVGVLAISKGLLLILLQNLNIYSLSTFLDSTLDSTVGPKSSGGNTLKDGEDYANSIEVMRRCKWQASNSSDKNAASSGFESRSSCTPSLRSNLSFASVHSASELERTPSQLTIHEERISIPSIHSSISKRSRRELQSDEEIEET